MQVETRSRNAGWCQIRSEAVERFAELGLRTAADFLAMPGIVVGGHVGRNVSRVDLGGAVGYLKREHTVRWRDRWRNLLAGFGPASMSRREWSVLRYLEANGLPGPRWLACGEADGRAFLLLEGVSDATDLRRAGHVDGAFAAALGRTIARLHAAGVDQPDLFAKHFLIDPSARTFTILDWQRATPRATVSHTKRIAALGTFLASCPPGLLTDVARGEFLRAYRERDTSPERERRPNLSRRLRSGLVDDFVPQVTRAADRATKRPSIRSQRVVSSADQELVRIGGETVCAIPEVARDLAPPDVIAALHDPANDGRPFRLRDGRVATLRVRRYANPLARWFLALRGKAWRSAELKTARLLFHLERHGIGAPRLLAYGQVAGGRSATSFVLVGPLDAGPIGPDDLPQVRTLLDRLHEAGCVLVDGIVRTRSVSDGSAAPPGPSLTLRVLVDVFGILNGRAVVVEPSAFQLRRSPSRRQLARDRARVAALFRTCP